MFFKKKKKEEPKKNTEHPLKKKFMEKSNNNVQRIIGKLEEKRERLFKMEKIQEGKEEEVNERFNRIVHYMETIDWNSIIDRVLCNACLQDIDGAFTNRVDEETVRFLLQMTWDGVREDVNSMINNLLIFVTHEGE